MTNASGGVHSQMRYYAHGEVRWSSGTLPTDRRDTGQREETGLGLYDYVARRYDPLLGRFIQADTIVPSLNPGDLNRYAYTRNNPLAYTDPDGHLPWWARYAFMQTAMTIGSSYPLRPLLHGRQDARQNSHTIKSLAADYQDVAPVMVAAAIAEQASDVERLFGIDLWERAALSVLPSKQDMSRGIAQLRPSEQAGLGLAGDLFDPATAIEGMYAKVSAASARIGELDPSESLAPTDRCMLLALAQNSGTGVVDQFFQANKDWATMLDPGKGNNARILRYFTLHLDWLLQEGWELPDGVDKDRWRQIVFADQQG